MFVTAIEIASKFTRPIHTISRNYGSDIVQASAATLFFVNAEGWALTCSHVAQVLIATSELLKKRQLFENDLALTRGKKNERKLRHQLEQKYGYANGKTFELLNTFVNCVDKFSGFDWKLNAKLDVALIHFNDFTKLGCDTFPVFPSQSQAKQGMFLCRLGYPFAEFSNYAFDPNTDTISWTDEGRKATPSFPIEGMLTRFLAPDGKIIGFEMSTPGLRGQSGGPVFDAEGIIWGMQASTAHLDLDFDVNQEVLRNGKRKRVSDSAFLHVGRCVHVNALKDFMRENNVKFQEN